ncbi:class F sortase [Candidatus Saccharibacteria bacterium]|nr:class F sortase [Candidatus Saccharibacteria bacterium]
MSLKLGVSWKRIIQWVVITAVVVFVAACFTRLMVWEDNYYREMEGSERDVVANAVAEKKEEEPLIEEPPTEEEVYEYWVAPDLPRYLSIDKLGIYDARILQVGINPTGELATPNNIFDVGWYESSGKPGSGGTLLIDGHNGGPNVYGVFKRLPLLENGDIIIIERGDGVIFHYSVVENISVPLEEADKYMATALRSPEPGTESLTLITCTGEWSDLRYTYLSRQFTRALLIWHS